MSKINKELTFQVHPSVIFKLGEDLITDDYQALSELAKNCYDADASRSQISIFTNKWYCLQDGVPMEVENQETGNIRGMIEIADDGFGMAEKDIERGWLTISASKKREMKRLGETTPRGRTPLGDKGLGRLGAQRLGSILEMVTKTVESETLNVLIDWGQFEGENALSNIPVPIRSAEGFGRSHGTTIRIYGLENVEQWKDKRALQEHFIDIISPYSSNLGFSVELNVDDEPIDLREQSSVILKHALLTYNLNYSCRIMCVQGKISTHYLGDLSKGDALIDWRRYIAQDNGKEFYEWLISKRSKLLKAFDVSYVGEDETFLQAAFSFRLDEIDKIERDNDEMAYDPGDFTGRIDYVARQSSVGNYPDIENPAQYIDAMKGVRVYRDGFGVPVKDIIAFAQQWSSGRSWFTLRPANTIGYINISAEKNAKLVETSNREAFRDDAFSRNLKRILAYWLDMTAQLQTVVRRGYNEFIKEHTENVAGIESSAKTRDLAASAKRTFDCVLESYGTTKLNSSEFTKVAERGKAAVDVLIQRLDGAEVSVNDAWELAGLGIAAESVSHEASNIAQRIIKEAQAIKSRNSVQHQDREINGSAIRIISMANALTKEVAHLDSSLKYVRNRKDMFSVLAFAKDSAEYARPKLVEKGIDIEVRGSNYSVRMNQGRLSQVVDNLIDNSCYWLLEAIKLKAVSDPKIIIELKEPYLLVYDNGWGIHNSVEMSLFEPFVSRKGEGRGRGLGLYISRQLLDAEECSITLEDVRNVFGNRFRFRIDLSKVEVR